MNAFHITGRIRTVTENVKDDKLSIILWLQVSMAYQRELALEVKFWDKYAEKALEVAKQDALVYCSGRINTFLVKRKDGREFINTELWGMTCELVTVDHTAVNKYAD